MSDAKTVLKFLKEKEVKFLSLRFTDPRGKWQHLAIDMSMVDEDFLNEGTRLEYALEKGRSGKYSAVDLKVLS